MLSSLDHPETGSASEFRFYLKRSVDLFGLCSVTILNFPLSLMERSEESSPCGLRLEDPSQNYLRMTKKEERNDFHRFVGIG